jgi:CRP-like cAMP-binding protein
MPTADATRTALARTPILKHLSEQGLARLAERGLDTGLAAGARLFARGDPGDALYVIVEGEIEVSILTAAAKQVRLASLGPGDVVGEMAVLDDHGRSADATALRRTRLVKLGRDAVREALLAEPEALFALVQDLSGRIRHANDELEAAKGLDLRGRLARLLLRESEDGARLVQLTQTEMARQLSASREKVNRALHTFRSMGAVELTRAGVKLVRVADLSDAAHSEPSEG